LMDLTRFYKREAEKCEQQRAYLAGSILYGAALEAGLLAMARCYPSQVRRTRTYQRHKGQRLDKWELDSLLKLGRELNWTLSKLPIDKTARKSGVSPERAYARGDLGYAADVVREIRDMAHPGRYVRLWKGVKITKGYYVFCETIVRLVFDHLYQTLEQSIRKSLEKKASPEN
jgi:hypothetical protein